MSETTTEIIPALKALRLHGMASSYADLLEQRGASGSAEAQWLLQHLLQAERTDRALRSIRNQMHAARFPIHRDLAGFDFEQSKVDRRQIETFATTAFIEKTENIVLIGGAGTGKTHLATAITASVVRAGARGRYFNTIDLVTRLEEEARIGRPARLPPSSAVSSSSCSMNWAICRSPAQAASCCST